ncbi:MAG: sialate O-acetylesterase [Tannerellaceae bacterium]|jgi:sialate O-acetylesterase|nr:sialate O-acetylesterase [Tannerellaceae bacterium]
MKHIKWTLSLLCGLLIANSGLNAKVKLPSILGDHLVLQQQSQVKLWGEAEAKALVTVKTSWDKKTYTATADAKGAWLLSVETPVAGGPYEISIRQGQEIVLSDVLIGEVWFCSGQSNMEMPVRGFDGQPIEGANETIAAAKPRTPIRMFTTDSKEGNWVRQFSKQPQTDCQGEWLEHSSAHVANISAVAYFFAQQIQESLDVPVGVIVSSWGGSKLEAWMSRESLVPFTEVNLSHLDTDEAVRQPTSTPCVLYNAKIAPLTNFAIKGFLWYQGESNRDKPELYERLMPVFVTDLRQKWKLADFPFYFVQIAPYYYEDANGISAARFRDAQLRNMKDIPHTGMAMTLDIGDSLCIHPADKKTVGKRLAWWALSQTYGKAGIGYRAPEYKSMEIAGNKIIIDFEHAPYGLSPQWQKLSGFEIAGENKTFLPAEAEIDLRTRKIVVSHKDVAQPVAVRYAYKNYTKAGVFDMFGIPLTPFRTDDW